MRSSNSVKYILDVPFSEKDEAKEDGARWDSSLKKWYINSDHANCDYLVDKFSGYVSTPKIDICEIKKSNEYPKCTNCNSTNNNGRHWCINCFNEWEKNGRSFNKWSNDKTCLIVDD